ncbi:MAG: protein translocase subunit SecF [Rhodospirillales bacterium]
MRHLRLVPADTRIRFVERRAICFVLSALLVAASVALFTFKGLNYGIDFKGGILLDVRTEGSADLAGLRRTLGGLGLGEVSLQEFGAPDNVLIRIQQQPGGEEAQLAAVARVKEVLGTGIEYRRTEFVGPKVSAELFWDGIYAVTAAILAILVYIWFRFEWQFGLAAVVALTHDVLATIGIFSLIGLEFNLSTVAAVLTIAGYSINDTVVVFDRVRENLRKYKKMPLGELLDLSINQTLSRTLMTSVTTLLALGALYVLGGEVIRGFAFGMIWGVVIGTYSTVFVAVPLLLYLNVRRGVIAADAAAEAAGGPGS